MSDINLVFFVYGDYKNYPLIKECIKLNTELIKPKSIEIIDDDKLQNMVGSTAHFKNCKGTGGWASDMARLIYLQNHPNTLYIDADVLISKEAIDFILAHKSENLVAGYFDEKYQMPITTPAHLCYSGDSRSRFFDEMIQKYEEFSTENPNTLIYDSELCWKYFKTDTYDKNGPLIGNYADTKIVFFPCFHIGMARFKTNADSIKHLYIDNVLVTTKPNVRLERMNDACFIITEPSVQVQIDSVYPTRAFINFFPKSLQSAAIQNLKYLIQQDVTEI